MQAQRLAEVEILRPSRLNYTGWCMYCASRYCQSARCIEMHARSVWEICTQCGGSEYVNGHVDPENAFTRCRDCFGGLVEAQDREPVLAEVVELRPAAVAKSTVPSGHLVFDINDPDAWL